MSPRESERASKRTNGRKTRRKDLGTFLSRAWLSFKVLAAYVRERVCLWALGQG